MWEVLVRTPLGRHSLRKFIVLLATLLVAVFGYTLIQSTSVFAAENATWKDSSIVYNDHTYEGPKNAIEGDGTKLENGTTYYEYRDDASQKAYLIYFAPGTDPPNAQEATLAEYQILANTPTGPLSKKTIRITPQDAADPNGNSLQEGELNSCQIDGVGWLVCPLTRHIAKAMDYIYGIISEFLEVKPLETTQQGVLYTAWSMARNIANVLFVIGFLILIYGQLSGGLASNYMIKKLLPRIVIAAILVNISYWVCAIGVDLSNILGYAVQDMFVTARNTLTQTPMEPITWEHATEYILTGGTATIATGTLGAAAFVATGGSIVAAVYLLLPAIVGVILAALVALIVLAMRQALIVLLIIIAPLAFVAYLLPNTEKWFERWRQTFMTMLLLFPIFSLIFGGSQLAGTAIIQTAKSPAIAILGMVVMVAPLVITPIVIKFSGSLLGRIAGMINNPNKGLIDRTRNMAKPRAEYHRDKKLAQPNQGGFRNRSSSFNPAKRYAQRSFRKDMIRKKEQESFNKEAEDIAHNYSPSRTRFETEGMYAVRQRHTKTYADVDDRYRNAEFRHQKTEAHHEKYWEDKFNRNNSAYDEGLARERLDLENYKAGTKESQDTFNAMAAAARTYQTIRPTDDEATVRQKKEHNERLKTEAGLTDDFIQQMKVATATSQSIAVEGLAIKSAEVTAQGQLAALYDSGQKVRDTDIKTAIERAGGIDKDGQIKIRAQAKTDILKLYMENVNAVNSLLSNEGYEPQEQLKIIQERKLRGDQEASDFHVYAALERTLTTNGNNWSAQKIIDYAATQGMESLGNGKFRGYNDAGQLVELTDQEVSDRRDFQQMVLQYINKSPLKVDYLTATMRSRLETGTFMTEPGKAKSEELILGEVNVGKYDQQRIVNADVDVLQRMVQVFRDPNNRTAANSEARKKLMDAILEAQANPQVNASIKDRERGVMNTLVSYLDDSDTRSATEKEQFQYYIRDTEGHKLYSRTNAAGQVERITAETPGAQRESITVRAPQNYTLDNLVDQ